MGPEAKGRRRPSPEVHPPSPVRLAGPPTSAAQAKACQTWWVNPGRGQDPAQRAPPAVGVCGRGASRCPSEAGPRRASPLLPARPEDRDEAGPGSPRQPERRLACRKARASPGRRVARGQALGAPHPAEAAPASFPRGARLEWLLLIPFVTNPGICFPFYKRFPLSNCPC